MIVRYVARRAQCARARASAWGPRYHGLMPSNVGSWRSFRTLSDQRDRLSDLGVVLSTASAARTRVLFARFVDEFVEPSRGAELMALREDREDRHRPVEIARWLRPDRTRRGGPMGCMRWLSEGHASARCVRFDRRGSLPAIEIDPTTIDDTWAASWPGVFVSFEAGRAVVITLDYEDIRCDVRAALATPYR
ncbi:Hypothetical protein A7982_04711 [Minicystis rosea]|nr:Hypothetical protein A7982_04711 [Minicystis rosea]